MFHGKARLRARARPLWPVLTKNARALLLSQPRRSHPNLAPLRRPFRLSLFPPNPPPSARRAPSSPARLRPSRRCAQSACAALPSPFYPFGLRREFPGSFRTKVGAPGSGQGREGMPGMGRGASARRAGAGCHPLPGAFLSPAPVVAFGESWRVDRASCCRCSCRGWRAAFQQARLGSSP